MASWKEIFVILREEKKDELRKSVSHQEKLKWKIILSMKKTTLSLINQTIRRIFSQYAKHLQLNRSEIDDPSCIKWGIRSSRDKLSRSNVSYLLAHTLTIKLSATGCSFWFYGAQLQTCLSS